MNCPKCGTFVKDGKFCKNCGTPIALQSRSPHISIQPTQRYRPTSSKPTTAGILLIIAGIDGLFNWVVAAVILSSMSYIPGGFAEICGIIGIIFCSLAIIGGFCAVNRKMWFMALIGSIFGLLTIGIMFEASVLSLVALILIAMSKDEFD